MKKLTPAMLRELRRYPLEGRPNSPGNLASALALVERGILSMREATIVRTRYVWSNHPPSGTQAELIEEHDPPRIERELWLGFVGAKLAARILEEADEVSP